jgi:peptidyl-prolyl cis-trans isomerase C
MIAFAIMREYNVTKKDNVWWVLPLLLLFLFSPLSCDKAKPLKEKELARINDRVITLEEFEQEMEQLPPHLKTLMIEEKGKKDFLQNVIERELLLQEGVRKGLDKDDKVLSKVEQFKQGLIIETLIEDLCAGKDAVSDEEVKAYYAENKKQYLLGERVRVRHIMVKTREEAAEIKKRLYQGEDFITLAKRYSIWPTKERGGDLGYIERGMVNKSFEQAAFALKNRGDLSDVVKTEFGFHIIRLEDRKKRHQLTFSEAKEEIRKLLREKKRKDILTAHLEELRKGAQIHINEKLLEEEKEAP